MQEVHGDESREDRDRQSQNRDQRRAEMEQESNRHEADDDGFFEEIALERFDGCLNQSGPVITGDDLDAGRKRRFDFELAFS